MIYSVVSAVSSYDRCTESIIFLGYRVFKDSLIDYAGDRQVRVHNWADDGYWIRRWFWQRPKRVVVTPSEPDVIVQRARDFLDSQQWGNYHVLANNCEVFATECRYGQGFSGQSIGSTWGLGGWFR